MASAPKHVRIRSYNVGFGDCFLLTFTYADADPRNVLIDFGSTKQADDGPPGEMLEIAERIREDCGGKLRMLVATHRHADHISGFAGDSGEVIASLEPDLVLQPWTEQPDLDSKATGPAVATDQRALAARAAASRLADMQAVAAAAKAAVPRLRASAAVPEPVVDEIEFLGDTNLSNREAVRNLAEMGKRKRAVYASFGTELALGRILPGVQVEVLGPPTLEQTSTILHQADTNEEEFWHLAARTLGAEAGGDGGSEVFPGAPTSRRGSQEARWLIPRIDRMRGEEVLAIVRSLDKVLNNTSLILLFEIGDTRLLFPGDAQLENWMYALRDCDEAEKIRERLAGAEFYKVGHHGSLNATPKTLWNGFEHRSAKPAPDRLATMVSTLAHKHGCEKTNTEVPRRVLIEELERMSDLHNTQDLKSGDVFWNDVELKL